MGKRNGYLAVRTRASVSGPQRGLPTPVGSVDDLRIPRTATGWILLSVVVTAVQHLAFPAVVAPVDSTTWSAVFEFHPTDPARGPGAVPGVFAHRNLAHLLLNVWLLVTYGWSVESDLGRVRTLGLFLAGGLAGHLALVALTAAGVQYGPVLGASAGGFALFAWPMAAFPRADARVLGTDRTVLAPVPLVAVVLGSVGVVAVLGYAAFGVSHLAHLGGVAAGVTSASVWRYRRGPGQPGAGSPYEIR